MRDGFGILWGLPFPPLQHGASYPNILDSLRIRYISRQLPAYQLAPCWSDNATMNFDETCEPTARSTSQVDMLSFGVGLTEEEANDNR